MRGRAALWATLLAALSLARSGGGSPPCGGSPTIDLAGLERRLSAAEALWGRRGPDAYRLALGLRSAWERSDLLVSVRPGARPRVRVTTFPLGLPGEPVPAPVTREGRPELAASFAVPDLFAGLRSLLREVSPRRPCGILELTFDPHDGHPRALRFDNAFAIDEDFRYTASPLLPPR